MEKVLWIKKKKNHGDKLVANMPVIRDSTKMDHLSKLSCAVLG